jgi:hypothetical protein
MGEIMSAEDFVLWISGFLSCWENAVRPRPGDMSQDPMNDCLIRAIREKLNQIEPR